MRSVSLEPSPFPRRAAHANIFPSACHSHLVPPSHFLTGVTGSRSGRISIFPALRSRVTEEDSERAAKIHNRFLSQLCVI